MAQGSFDDVITLLRLSRNAPDIFENAEIEEKRTLLNTVLSNLELNEKLLRWKIKNHTIRWLFVMKIKIGSPSSPGI